MIKFSGDWTEDQMTELRSVIMKSSEETYCHSDAYNYWIIDKYNDGIWGRRLTWDI